MENYIRTSLLSIINESFKNFEIIIVNDKSNDNTQNIINEMQFKDNRIKYINHSKNLGVYASRIDAVLNAKGKYILLMDPDDIILNKYLFQKLHNYNKEYNLDIIEFLVYHQTEGTSEIIFPKDHEFSHYHYFNKKIIKQPELSNIIFYIPNSKNYTSIKCRTIWNKIIRKEIIINSINYLNNDYFKNQFLIAADDTPLNILAFQFANNYSNIIIPGYLYVLRNKGVSRLEKENNQHNKIISYNFLLYFKFLLRYVKKFKKDINFFFYDLSRFSYFLMKLKEINATEYLPMTIEFFEKLNERDIPIKFKPLINQSIKYLIK